jgi:hypothetical protein
MRTRFSRAARSKCTAAAVPGGVEIDHANEVPATLTKGVDQRTVDVGIGVKRETTGHYRS